MTAPSAARIVRASAAPEFGSDFEDVTEVRFQPTIGTADPASLCEAALRRAREIGSGLETPRRAAA